MKEELSAYAASLFLGLLVTDLLDGYLARRLGLSSRLGAYFDATTDFVLIIGMPLVFGSEGFLPIWVLAIIVLYFVQFVVTSFYWGRIYDPAGKYYGTLLYGAIGLRFLVSGQLFAEVVAAAIIGFTMISFSARLSYLRGVIKPQPN
jgi:phosphatidylglycerophosphate synthase